MAGYVKNTASKMADEASKAVEQGDLKGVSENIDKVKESASSMLQETRDNFIKEKLPEIANIDMTEVWKNITCEKALSIYDNYISGDMAGNDSEENVYTVLSILRQQGKSESEIKDAIKTLFCGQN